MSREPGARADPTSAPAYVQLAERCERIDARHTRYRFDLEADIPWDQLQAPGVFFGPTYLRALGIDAQALDEEAGERLQWALALATCGAFHELESLICRFADEEAVELGPTRSMQLLCDEERKHMELFSRYADRLRRARPALASAFDAAFQPAVNLLGHLHEREAYPHAAAYHYLFWVNTVFFEEFTVWLDDVLAVDQGIQPAWRVAHEVHRREEVQHLVTDAAHLEALNLSDVERYQLSKLFLLRLEDGFDRFFGVEAALSIALGELPPRSFRDLPLFGELLSSPAFRRTRQSAPCLQALARMPATARATDAPASLRGPALAPFGGTLGELLDEAGDVELVYTLAEGELRETASGLRERALHVLAALQGEGLVPGDPVMIILPEPRAFLGVFWACLLGGMVPVPLGLSLRRRPEDDASRLEAVRQKLGDPLVVVAPGSRESLPDAWRVLPVDELSAPGAGELYAGDPEDVALIQFSSGSTGAPRGVVLSHANLLANAQAALQHLRVSAQDVVVSWMPLHHDMGLAYHLTPLLGGARQVLLTPMQFARRPMRWLESLSRHGATISASPNFGYAQVLRRLKPERLDGLDLSRMRVLLNGAEPVSVELARRFTRSLAPTGLRADAIQPAYGLAEATCAVSMLTPGHPIREHLFDRDTLDAPEGPRSVQAGHPRAASFAGVGAPVPGVEVRVRAQPGAVGEIEVRGASVTRGYLGDPEASRELLRDGWLRTGDLGLLRSGELVVTGRAKDVIFVAGRNLFAGDLEAVLREVPGIGDRVAVVGVTHPQSGLEQVIPFVRLGGKARRADVVAAVAARLGEAIAYPVEEVVVLPAEFFPRTTSGKIQRHRLRQAFERGELDDYVIRTRRRGESARLARQAEGAWAEASGERPALELEAPETGSWPERIRLLWAEALDLLPSEVGLDQGFYALGGDSLLAVEVHGRLEEICGRALDVRLLRDCRTVRETASYVQAEVSGSAPGPASEPPPEQVSQAGIREEDIAVVGMACRFPGAPDIEAFWELLREGRVATGPVPAERWDTERHHDPDPSAPGKTVCVEGGFLEGVRTFDAEAFGIPAEEARQIDPQQRIFLEVASDALARAGCATRRVGVFAGAGGNEYFQRNSADPYRITRQSAPANLDNMLSARVSQRLGLTGPALTVNAACATSLVAVQLACRSLRAGECEVALAGGSQLNLTVLPFLLFSQAGVLSASGRCRPYARQADGFVPGEGAGVVVLKPLATALRDADPIVGIIRGGATNNDGGALSGMAPNPAGQRDVIGQAYRAAGVDPCTISYVEGHGTGTQVGDPVEVRALGQVFQAAGAKNVGLGSVKANIGHLLNAAGVASLIKVLLALQHEVIPSTPGCEDPDPRLPFGEVPLAPVAEARPWARGTSPRRAAVSAFGIGGTNCHLIVEEAPTPPPLPAARDAHLLCFSAPDPAGLARQAARYADALADPAVDVAGFCALANAGAARFALRRAVVGSDRASLRAALARPAQGRRPRATARVVFVLPGPGSQYPGMGRHLLAEPAFANALDACDRVVAPLLGRSLRLLLDDPAMDAIEHSQPVVFAFSYALARWLQHLGLEPDALIGHSAGEYAAAVLAGVLSLEEALQLVTRRGIHMSRTVPGRMAAVFAPEEVVRAHLVEDHEVGIAALNEPSQVVVSGDPQATDFLLERLRKSGIESRPLTISCAAHSTLMAPAAEAFAVDLQGVRPRTPRLPIFSTVVGARVAAMPRAYWTDHMRAPVRFARAVRAALAAGHRHFVELAASGALSHCISQVVAADAAELEPEIDVVPLVRRSIAGWAPTLEALGALFELGASLDLRRLGGASRRRPVAVPGYPFARKELWLDPPAIDLAPGIGRGGAAELRFALETDPAIRDHRVHGTPVAPAALLFDRVLGALSASHVGCALHDIVIGRPLVVEAGTVRQGRLREAERTLRLETTAEGDDAGWVEHLSAQFRPMRRSLDWPDPSRDLGALKERCAEEVNPEVIYERLAAGGLTYGPSVRTLRRVWRGAGELLARLELPADAPIGPHRLHPGLVDGAMQSVAGLTLDVEFGGIPTFLGFAVRRLAVQAPVDTGCYAHVTLRSELSPDVEAIRCDVALLGDDGAVLASFDEVCLKRFHPRDRAELAGGRARFYGLEAAPIPPLSGRSRLDGALVIAGDASALRSAIEREVEAAGGVALLVGTEGIAGQLAADRQLLWIEPTLDELGALAAALEADGIGGLTCVGRDPCLLGFLRSLDRERPGWGCRLLRPRAGLSPTALARGVCAELSAPREYLVLDLLEEGERTAPRLVPREAPPPEAVEPVLRPRGVYWITGGLGGIGLALAETFAARVGARLLLTGRRPHAEPEVLRRIDRAGGEALYVPGDVTDKAAMRRALEIARDAWGEVHGVIHAAGVLADAAVGERTAERSRAVLAPKVEGARVLAEVTAAEDLDFLALCSSLSGLFGVAGQTDYAAANAYLDAFASQLRHGGARILSVAWGPWRDVGMVKEERYQQGFRGQGLRPFGRLAGGEAFLGALALPGRRLAVVDVEPSREGALLKAFNRPAGFGAVERDVAATDASVVGFLCARLAGHLRCAAEDIDPAATFQSLGVDSLMAVAVVRDLERHYGVRLYPTLLFEFQTAQALAGHLEGSHGVVASTIETAAEERVPAAPGDVVAWCTDGGAGLRESRISVPEPGPQEVEIEVRAAGVNFIDLLAAAGAHPVIHEDRFVPGHEVAGVVRRVGAEVQGLSAGDRVMALVGRGGYAARAVAHQATTLPLPEGTSFSDGAGIVVTGLTAVGCVEVKGRVAWGERVLVQAAAGATGLACVQLALHHGAVVFGTASASEKLAHLRRLGVAHPIDYRSEPFVAAVRRLTSGEGVDVVIDSLSGEAIAQGLSILRSGGRFIEIGAAGVVDVPLVDPKQLFLANQDFATVNVARLEQSPTQLAATVARLAALLREGVLTPQVGHLLPFSEAPAALRLLRERRNLGKVVLVFE